MQNENLISVNEFCQYHHIDVTFIQRLEENGLIETTTVHQTVYVQTEQLSQLEKFIRLNQELNIDAENLDIISHLLQQTEILRQEITALKSRLNFYEQFENNPTQPE
jgi:chaperone modulatory protein CbpM